MKCDNCIAKDTCSHAGNEYVIGTIVCKAEIAYAEQVKS